MNSLTLCVYCLPAYLQLILTFSWTLYCVVSYQFCKKKLCAFLTKNVTHKRVSYSRTPYDITTQCGILSRLGELSHMITCIIFRYKTFVAFLFNEGKTFKENAEKFITIPTLHLHNLTTQPNAHYSHDKKKLWWPKSVFIQIQIVNDVLLTDRYNSAVDAIKWISIRWWWW